MKTNPLRATLFALILLQASGVASSWAAADNTFDCLRDMMPITDRASFVSKRGNVEEPFLVNDKFIVFPEVTNGVVSGFYFYGPQGVAAFYDAVEITRAKGRNETRHIGDLVFRSNEGIYEMVAQPSGLETVTVSLLPGFQNNPTGRGGPVVLGSSVLPVIGAFVSRPAMTKSTYHNPSAANESDIKKWIVARQPTSGGRQPASADTVQVTKTIVRLKSVQNKNRQDLWRPLETELKLRKQWVKTHNLDEKSFKQLSLVLEGSCKE